MTRVRDEVAVAFRVEISDIIANADPDQSGSSPLTNGFRAAADRSSTVAWLRSQESEFDETATTRLPSEDATASSTVFAGGSRDSSRSAAQAEGDVSVPKLDTYSSLTETPVVRFVLAMASLTVEKSDPRRFSVSVMSSLSVVSDPVSVAATAGMPEAAAKTDATNARIRATTMRDTGMFRSGIHVRNGRAADRPALRGCPSAWPPSTTAEACLRSPRVQIIASTLAAGLLYRAAHPEHPP